MHKSSLLRMEWFKNNYLKNDRKLSVLDVGSYNVNGCYKPIFESDKFEYTGLDMEEGPNVDLKVNSAYKWSEINEEKYDVAISGQALEHAEFFCVTMAEIIRVTKKDGLICLIVPNGFAEHRYPVDCWRFFTDGMIALARYYKLEILHAHTNSAPNSEYTEWFSSDCADAMLIARKPYSGVAKIVDLENYSCIPAERNAYADGFVDYEEYEEKRRKVFEQQTELGEGKQERREWGHTKTKGGILLKRCKDLIKKYIK